MDYEKLDKIFSKYEQIGDYVHRDRFGSLFEDIIELHEKAINKNSVIPDVSGSTFTNEELQTIKIDILHIYDKISLSETEVHKRNSILNKIKNLLGDEYYRQRAAAMPSWVI